MKNYCFGLTVSILFTMCASDSKRVELNKIKEEVIENDIAFSNRSVQIGYIKAFIEYGDDNLIKLNPRRFASFGKKQLIEDAQKDSSTGGTVLTWKPLHVVVADAGDMASAFGDWSMKVQLPNKKDTVFQGNYITIWKKQPDGLWKFILDGGNPTPGPTNPELLNRLTNR